MSGNGLNISRNFYAPYSVYNLTYGTKVLSNGKILVYGCLEISDIEVNGLTLLNSDGSVDTGFTSNMGTGFNGWVYDTHIQDSGKIVCVGSFTSFNGNSVGRICRLNSNGTYDSSFGNYFSTFINPAANDVIRCITYNPNRNKYLLGGDFTTYGTPPAHGISNLANRAVEIDTDGLSETNYHDADEDAFIGTFAHNGGFNNGVYDIEITSNSNVIIVVGEFTEYQGNGSIGAIAIDVSAILSNGWGEAGNISLQGESGSTYGLTAYYDSGSSSTYIGGVFTGATSSSNSSSAKNIAKFNSTTVDTSFGTAVGDRFENSLGVNKIVKSDEYGLLANVHGKKVHSFTSSGTTGNTNFPLDINGTPLSIGFNGEKIYLGLVSEYAGLPIYYPNTSEFGMVQLFQDDNTAPTGVTVTEIDLITADVDWINTYSGCTGITVIYTNDELTYQYVSGLTSGTTTTNLTGLTPNTTYYVTVVSESPDSFSFSEKVTYVTRNPAPTGLTTSNVGYYDFDLTWVNVETGITYNLVPQLYSGSTWNNMATLSSGATTYSFTGLTAGETYDVRVAILYEGVYYPSESVIQQTITNLYAGEISGDQSTCDNENISGITTTISPSGGCTPYSYQWQSGTTVGAWSDIAGETSADLDISPILETTHYFRKQVVDDCDTTGYTNTVTKTVYDTYAGNMCCDQSILSSEQPDELSGSTPTGGSGNYSYMWQYTTDTGSTWTDAPSGYTQNYLPAPQTETTYWRRRVYDNYCFKYYYSDILTITVDAPQAPSGLTASNYTCDGWDLTWVNNGSKQGDIEVWWLDLSIPSWVQYNGSYPSGTTGITMTGFTINQGGLGSTDVRVSNIYDGYYYTSDNLTGLDPVNPRAVNDLSGVTSGCSTVILTWSNPPCWDSMTLDKVVNGITTEVAVLTGQTSYVITGITETTVSYNISTLYDTTYYVSSSYDFEIPLDCQGMLPYCELPNPYDINEPTCGNMNGEIVVPQDYTDYYDFYLGDPFGASYDLTVDRFYVTAGWYALVAVPKQDYWNVFGRDICTISWIQVDNSDTTMSLTQKSVRDSSCNTFGAESGRIVYFCEDSYAGSDYDVYLFDEAGNIVSQTNESDISQLVFTGLFAGEYYLMILNNSSGNGGCRLLVDAVKINSLSSMAVAGVKNLWVTEWNNTIEYNYWTAEDEDFYVSGIRGQHVTQCVVRNPVGYQISDL